MNNMILQLLLYLGGVIYSIGFWFSLIDVWRNGESWQRKAMIIFCVMYSPLYSLFSYVHKQTKPAAILLNCLGVGLVIIHVITVRLLMLFGAAV